MLTIYHNPRCSKSRETLKIIEEAGQEVEVVEYLKSQPTSEDISRIVGKLGIKPEQLIRKGEKIYKEQYKDKDLTDDEWIEAMVQNPVLIERPIVIQGDKAVIGRPPKNVEELL